MTVPQTADCAIALMKPNAENGYADLQTCEGTRVRALGKQEATQWILIRPSLYFPCTKNETIMKRITITSQLSSSSHLA
jgi:hypothetical protein